MSVPSSPGSIATIRPPGQTRRAAWSRLASMAPGATWCSDSEKTAASKERPITSYVSALACKKLTDVANT